MPFYEYICEVCNKEFVLLQSVTVKTEDTVCPYCDKKKARKLVSVFAAGGSEDACRSGGHSWGGG